MYNLHRYYADHAAPTKPDPAAVEQGHVEAKCSSPNLLEHIGIVSRDSGREWPLSLLDFARRTTVFSIHRDLFLEGILSS
jgi:hypothetical protein